MPLVRPRPPAEPKDDATQALPTLTPKTETRNTAPPVRPTGSSGSDDTVILPAFRSRTSERERERPPATVRDEPPKAKNDDATTALPPVPPDAPDLEKPARRGPSRAMIAICVAVVLVLAAAWLLVSLPGAPGKSTDFAGDAHSNWPPAAPSGSPAAAQTPSQPAATLPSESVAPGEPAVNGVVPVPSAGTRVGDTPVGTEPSNGPSTAPAASPTPSPMFGGDTNGPGQIEAEAFAWQRGVTVSAVDGAAGGRALTGGNGDWVRFDAVNFGTGPVGSVKVRIANGSGASGRIEVRYDSPWSAPVATVSVDNTGGWAQWRTRSVSCGTTSGSKTVFVSFASRASGDFVHLDWISFA